MTDNQRIPGTVQHTQTTTSHTQGTALCIQGTNRYIQGTMNHQNGRFAIVFTHWNAFVVDALVKGAENALLSQAVPDHQITAVRCPGAFELPLTAQKLAKTGRFDAIIALGAVIRGETAHFEYISQAATQGLARVQLDTGIPVAFGLLTVDSLEQAMDRAGAKAGNKGEEAALAAYEMVSLLQKLEA